MKISPSSLGLAGLAVVAVAVVGGVSVTGHASPGNSGAIPLATSSAAASTASDSVVGVNSSKTVAAWIGDTWITGLNGGGVSHGIAALTTQSLNMDWQIAAQPETGFATKGIAGVQGLNGTFPERVAAVVALKPKLVVVAGGTNDAVRGASAADVRAGVQKTVTELRAGLPGVPVVIVGPSWTSLDVPADVTDTSAVIKAAAGELNVPFVDPLGEHWLTADTAADYVAKGNLTVDGNKAYADDLVRDLTTFGITA